ncbi:hypothetical protein [Pleomorphomonas oryzae]|uniref:hypothetical protein n=1 Tax=Pleomorphomonas oryzae TaxID=261934 RepID=UPI00047B3DBA|nr:hypothetical protein [Pleomorphomonas oryzae]
MLENLDATEMAERIGATWRKFAVKTTRATPKVTGWVLGAWGCRDEGGGWGLTHLPTGLRVPYQIDDECQALKAMSELVALTNDWVLSSTEVADRFGGRICEIMQQHGAKVHLTPVFSAVSPNLNGEMECVGHA